MAGFFPIECGPRFCADYHGDLEEARLMKRDNPDSIFIVRYEDLCQRTAHYARRLMEFLTLPETTDEMEEYIVTHSKKRKKNKFFGDRSQTIFSKTYRVVQMNFTPEIEV